MSQQSLSDGSAINPDTVCLQCGLADPEDSMVICDLCLQGFHTACFGLSGIPEADMWHCLGCSTVQQLAAGQLVVTESPQELYPSGIADPHLTQGLYLNTVISVAPLKRSSAGCSRQVQLLANAAPLPNSVRFYSRGTFRPLAKIPRATQELAAALCQQTHTAVSNVTLSSCRYGMLGTPAAAAGVTTEACLAGSNCVQEAVQALAGPPRQAYLLQSHEDISNSSSSSKGAAAAPSQPPAAAAVVHPGELCSSQPAQAAAVHISTPCRNTQHTEQLQQGLPAAASAGVPAGPQASPAGVTAAATPGVPGVHPAVPLATSPGVPGGLPRPPAALAGPAADWSSLQFPTAAHAAAATALALSSAGPAAGWPGQQQQLAAPSAFSWQLPHTQQQGPFMMPPYGAWGPPGWPGWPFFAPPAAVGFQPAALVPGTQQPGLPGTQHLVMPPAGSRGRQVARPRPAGPRGGRQLRLTEEAHRSDEDGAAADSSDDDWLASDNAGAGAGAATAAAAAAAAGPVAKVVYKVLATPRCRGSRMRINPSLVKQQARQVCAVGVPLWRHVLAQGSSSSGGVPGARLGLSPAQLRKALNSFASQAPGNATFLQQPENRNMAAHIQVLLQLLSPTDDPLTISADILTARIVSLVRLSAQRTTSLNNVLSAARCGFRLLFGRCLTPGIDAAPTTVTVAGDKLRIDLHSPLPDAAVIDFTAALQTWGGLAREPAGVIRTFETFLLQLAYSWHTVLHSLADLQTRWQHPQHIPATTLAQIHRWCGVLLAQLFRGAVDHGRPSDIALYHLGCFQLVLPGSSSSIPLAAVVLHSLQQQQPQHSMDAILEAFRAAGAVLHVKAPKCKQNDHKRSRNGNQCLDWVPLRKHIMPVELALLCPTRTLCFCMAAMWWCNGAVAARLLTQRTAGSSGKAAPKRHQQADIQAQSVGCWKAPTSQDLHSSMPTLYLLQKQQQAAADGFDNSSGSDSNSSETETAPANSNSSSSSSSLPDFGLSHQKPRKGAAAAASKVVLELRPLVGYDLRHSQQKCHLQCGVPLEQSARLAAHTVDECKKYAANANYELSDATATPLKLASPEWFPKDPLPIPLGPGGSIFGVPFDGGLFDTAQRAGAVAAAAAAAAEGPLAPVLEAMADSIRAAEAFISSFAELPDLNERLHAPVLGKGGSAEQLLPVTLLREWEGVMHLRSGPISGFLSRLPRISARGLGEPAADRVVRPELVGVFGRLAADIGVLSAGLRQEEGSGEGGGGPQLRISHYSQVTFGRPDVAWARLQQQQQQAEQVGSLCSASIPFNLFHHPHGVYGSTIHAFLCG